MKINHWFKSSNLKNTLVSYYAFSLLEENIPNNVAFENNFVVDVKLLIALDYTISDYLKIETHIIILHTKCQVFFPRIFFFQELAQKI
jgi:hypothetical protein